MILILDPSNKAPLRPNDRRINFDLYRFQLLPIGGGFQKRFDSDISTTEELVAKKNEILSDILTNKNIFLDYQRSKIVFRLEYFQENTYIFRLGVKRNIKRSTERFTVEEIDDYPNLLVAINNSEYVQKIAIQRNYKAFAHTSTVANILEESLNIFLSKWGLTVYVKAIFRIEDYWSLIENYHERIQRLTFELIRPNLSNISSTLSEDFKKLQKVTDSHKAKVELEAGENSTIKVDQSNQTLSSLAEYASEGGGNISLKVKGVRRIIKTNESIVEFSIREMTITGNKDHVINIFNEFIGE